MQAERLLSLNGGTAEQIAAARAATDEALARGPADDGRRWT